MPYSVDPNVLRADLQEFGLSGINPALFQQYLDQYLTQEQGQGVTPDINAAIDAVIAQIKAQAQGRQDIVNAATPGGPDSVKLAQAGLNVGIQGLDTANKFQDQQSPIIPSTLPTAPVNIPLPNIPGQPATDVPFGQQATPRAPIPNAVGPTPDTMGDTIPGSESIPGGGVSGATTGPGANVGGAGALLNVLGAGAGGYGLYQGINQKNPLQALSGTYNLYSGTAPFINQATGTNLPTAEDLITSGASAVSDFFAPTAGATTGLGTGALSTVAPDILSSGPGVVGSTAPAAAEAAGAGADAGAAGAAGGAVGASAGLIGASAIGAIQALAGDLESGTLQKHPLQAAEDITVGSIPLLGLVLGAIEGDKPKGYSKAVSQHRIAEDAYTQSVLAKRNNLMNIYNTGQTSDPNDLRNLGSNMIADYLGPLSLDESYRNTLAPSNQTTFNDAQAIERFLSEKNLPGLPAQSWMADQVSPSNPRGFVTESGLEGSTFQVPDPNWRPDWSNIASGPPPGGPPSGNSFLNWGTDQFAQQNPLQSWFMGTDTPTQAQSDWLSKAWAGPGAAYQPNATSSTVNPGDKQDLSMLGGFPFGGGSTGVGSDLSSIGLRSGGGSNPEKNIPGVTTTTSQMATTSKTLDDIIAQAERLGSGLM